MLDRVEWYLIEFGDRQQEVDQVIFMEGFRARLLRKVVSFIGIRLMMN